MVRFAETRSEELDKLADHAMFAQPLGDHQHEVCGRGALGHQRQRA